VEVSRRKRSGIIFIPLEKTTDLNQWLFPNKADGGFVPPSSIPVRELSSLTGFITACTAWILSLMISCSGTAPSPQLVSYLKAEKVLRIRVAPGESQADSIFNLRRKYHINPELAIARLHGNPELWDKLFKELKNAK